MPKETQIVHEGSVVSKNAENLLSKLLSLRINSLFTELPDQDKPVRKPELFGKFNNTSMLIAEISESTSLHPLPNDFQLPAYAIITLCIRQIKRPDIDKFVPLDTYYVNESGQATRDNGYPDDNYIYPFSAPSLNSVQKSFAISHVPNFKKLEKDDYQKADLIVTAYETYKWWLPKEQRAEIK